MKLFWIKLVNLAAIAGILYGYHLMLLLYGSVDETARLKAELAQADAKYQAARQADSRKEEDLAETGGLYQDGTYTGEADGFGGQISLEVTIEEGRISDISVVSAEGEDPAYLSMAEGMLDAILEQQSADVDTVSGATFSSTGIKNAAAAALGKAGK